MSFLSWKTRIPSAKRALAYSAVCSSPGMTVASKARKKRVCLVFTVGGGGPAADVVIARGLAAVLDLGDFGGWPRQRLRELPAAESGSSTELTESFAEGEARLMDVGHARHRVGWQSHPVVLPYARQHHASSSLGRSRVGPR